MKFLPFDSITYRTNLSEDEVKKRLAENVGKANFFGLVTANADYSKPYKGEIDGNQFTIRRKINYNNSFLPRLHGTIEPDFSGTVIHIKMRMSLYTMIFDIVWLGVVFLVSLGISILIITTHRFHKPELIPYAMFLLVYSMTIVAFNWEKKIAIRDWQRIFDAEITSL